LSGSFRDRQSADRYGSGPPLRLVHGSFSGHRTDREFGKPLLETQFTVYALARLGRLHDRVLRPMEVLPRVPGYGLRDSDPASGKSSG
jgi:hypothetical protein